MRSPLRAVGSILLLLCLTGLARAADADGRWTAVHLLTLGRLPEGQPPAGVAEGESLASGALRHLRETLARDPAARRRALEIATQDALGRPATAAELESVAAGAPRGYTEHVQAHLERLATDPEEYAAVIGRAYRFVVRREAYPEEIAYWRQHDVRSYVLLVGGIEHWARRNQPGLMVTTGRQTVPYQSDFLTTVRLSPRAAAEVATALGLGANDLDGWRRAVAGGRTVLAPGAAGMSAAGGIHFAVIGGERLASYGWIRP